MKLNQFLVFFLLMPVVYGQTFAQEASITFFQIEKINDDYSVGYASVDEEFEGYGDMWIVSKNDTLPISEVEANLCSFQGTSPNGRFAVFETISMGWVYRSENDSILHDHWSGVVVELSSAKVVKYYRDDYGNSWTPHNLWLQGSTIVFNGSDTIHHSGGTVYQQDEESEDVSWITYFETGEVKETGQSSNMFGCGMNVGRHDFYTKEGVLIESMWYNNWLPENAEGCHEVIQDIHVAEYSEPYSKLKFRKMFQCKYEGEQIMTGIWRERNEDGKVISSVDHGLIYDPLKLQTKQVDIWSPEISKIQLVNFTDSILFTNGPDEWESESVSAINIEALELFIDRLEHHRLEPVIINYPLDFLGELRFTASGRERVYKLMKQRGHSFDLIHFEGAFYKLTKRGFAGNLIAPFISNIDKWNWESPFLSSELNGITEVQFESEKFESHRSSLEEYLKGFLKLKWDKHIEEPSTSEIGRPIGELTITHETGSRMYRFYEKLNQTAEEAFDSDYFYLEIEGDWFIGSYFGFYQFLLYQR